MRAAKNSTNAPIPVLNSDIDYGKANRKIPIWATRPLQNNHKIIKAFFQIKEEPGHVKYDALINRCSNAKTYPDTFIVDLEVILPK